MDATPQIPVIGVVNNRLRTTSLCLAVAYGSRHDPAGNGGVAHLLEHLLMAAPDGAQPSLCERIERLGGQANAETGLEIMLFHLRVHAEDAGEAVGWLADSVLRSALTDTALEQERAVVLQELTAAGADPCDTVQDAFFGALFPGHPLGRPVGGSAEQVRSITQFQVREVYEERFLAAPMSLTVVGPEIPDTAHRILRQRSEDSARLEVALSPEVVAAPPAWPDEFAWICVGSRCAAAGSSDGYADTVLASLCGASPSSLLYRRLRNEQGLAYSFDAWSRGYAESGAWRILAGVEPVNGDRLLDVIRTTLDDLATAGPDPNDLLAARRQAQMQLILDGEAPLEYARRLGQRTRAGAVPWSLEEDLTRLGAVTAEQVCAAARRIRDSLVTVVRPEPR
ncbi:pitrilysin family protein [Salinispora sp. H7-4]|uniref:M16 family metallopeptidase n=1 Tax=Salinispora sp. H7-4 TaxID=2748321 RepID=UPI0015D255A8|nr:pitrilysin family protein [Salinispora sp. H7-4]NYT92309.1 insulinase family protein [Salinispora sp. H7-4]